MKPILDIFRAHAILDAQGKHVNGCDKAINHNYSEAYQQILDSHGIDRANVGLMMEVGVGRGDSLLAWREIFPNATIVGLDIQQTAQDWLAGQERIEVHVGDATLPDVCDSVVGGRQFDLIVDDASHQIGDILATLLWLWPHVRAGGLYVIEDIVRHRVNFAALFPSMTFVDTVGTFEWSRVEPLMVLQKGQHGNG